MHGAKSFVVWMNLSELEKRFTEDGVRSLHALDSLAARFWRLGALVFRPDLFRMSHEVSSSAEGRRIVVWAVWVTGPARGRKNVLGNVSIRACFRVDRTMDLSRGRDTGRRLASRAARGRPACRLSHSRRRSGCVPAEPYPPLERLQCTPGVNAGQTRTAGHDTMKART